MGPRSRAAVGVGVVCVAAAVVFGLHLYPRQGADRVNHLVRWPGCESVTVDHHDREFYAVAWRGISEAAVLQCNMLGPTVFYARFNDRHLLDRALAAAPPTDSYCVSGNEFTGDGLFS